MQSYTTHDFTQSLHSSADAARNVISAVSSWTPQRQELLATLAEHEVMHEGQIIRHMYALDRPLPASWVWA